MNHSLPFLGRSEKRPMKYSPYILDSDARFGQTVRLRKGRDTNAKGNNMNKYIIFRLDMYEEYGLWYENERNQWGEIELDGEPTIELLQENSSKFSFRLMTGREVFPFENLSGFYVVDYYGDGTWYEVIRTADDCPVYGLQLKERVQ